MTSEDNFREDDDLGRRLSKVESDLSVVKAHQVDDRDRIHYLEKQTEAINNLATSVAVMASKQDTMNNELSSIKTSIKVVEEVPKKRYEALISIILAALVGGVVGFLLDTILF